MVVISFGVAFYFNGILPERIASHWDASGQVNGYASKFWGLFLMPMVLAVMFLIFILIPRVDPKKENIEKFRKYFDRFLILIFLFFFYIFGLTIYWNLGHVFDMTIALLPALAILFYNVGVLISKAEPNWSIGIRTPWTLSNETVWRKTHQLGGKLMKISAVLALVAMFCGKYAFFIGIVPIILSSFFAVIYSYFLFKRMEK